LTDDGKTVGLRDEALRQCRNPEICNKGGSWHRKRGRRLDSDERVRLRAEPSCPGHRNAGNYDIIDPTPIGTEIEKARATQPLDKCKGCARDLARLAHADRVLIGEVYKVSTLIGSLRLSIVDVSTGQSVFSLGLDFRGDTDEAWQHAVRFFVRDLEETAAPQR
jgi:hypothetical protein